MTWPCPAAAAWRVSSALENSAVPALAASATSAAESPELLVAHQYTRYLGDLFGGQMMGGMARSSLKLDDALGTLAAAIFLFFQQRPNVMVPPHEYRHSHARAALQRHVLRRARLLRRADEPCRG